jgi:ribosomal protein L30E
MIEIKKLLGSDKLIIGKERTMKFLRKGELVKVFLASNLDKESFEDIEHYASLSGTEVVLLKQSNDELGTFCKKPFSIAVIGLLK